MDYLFEDEVSSPPVFDLSSYQKNEIADLSSCQLHDLDSEELFPPSLTELDLTAYRLSSLDSRIAQLTNLKKISLRQNLINDAAVESSLSTWCSISDLEEIVLRDNQLMKIPDVGIFKKLLVFDVSFNEISSLNGLSSKVSSSVRELYVSECEVTKMEEIEHFHQLQILELGSNRLRVMENMQNLTHLRELWLGHNSIQTVNLCGLKCIKKICLQSNCLTSMIGFEECVALEELYLSHNGITKMEGLSTLVNLRVLDVSANKLTKISDIGHLTNLEDLWLSDNNIASLEGMAGTIAAAREKLTNIDLDRNPCILQGDEWPRVRRRSDSILVRLLACSWRPNVS